MPLRLLCLTAHPDDETAAFAGALLRAADAGIETGVFCLTEGDAGSFRAPGQSDADLARTRREEMARAVARLGIRYCELLTYPDGRLHEQNFQELVGVMTQAIRRFRPHVVLTFSSEGGVNLHRDHTVVSLAATAAFHWAGRSRFFPEQLSELAPWAAQKLYYRASHFFSTVDEEAQEAATMPPVSLRFDISPLLERQYAAFAEHTSQTGVLERVRAKHEHEMSEENYLLVSARNPQAEGKELWDGVVEET